MFEADGWVIGLPVPSGVGGLIAWLFVDGCGCSVGQPAGNPGYT